MMRMRTFSGTTSREVLQKVKHALGDDALIVSNREVEGRIEVCALAAADAMIAATVSGRAAGSAEMARALCPAEESSFQHEAPSSRVIHGTSSRPSHAAENLDEILSEIQSLKGMLQHREASFASAHTQPLAGATFETRELLKAGFTPEVVARTGTQAAADRAEAPTLDVATRLQAMVKLAGVDEVVETGGVYALVGPTGVGKTTTVAKLAARSVVRFGTAKIALLSTDGYRIGGYDQLRIYARILGVTVHAVRDSNDLRSALAELSGRHLVLIDTIGMSHRDRTVAEQAAMLAGAAEVKRLLLVQATTNTATLNDIVTAYKEHGVHGCIITKTDEAASLVPALDCVIRHELALHYVTDGQRVPEDLQLPDAGALARVALQPPSFAANEVVSVEQSHLARENSDVAVARDASFAGAAPEFEPTPLPKVIRPLGRHAHMRVVHG